MKQPCKCSSNIIKELFSNISFKNTKSNDLVNFDELSEFDTIEIPDDYTDLGIKCTKCENNLIVKNIARTDNKETSKETKCKICGKVYYYMTLTAEDEKRIKNGDVKIEQS